MLQVRPIFITVVQDCNADGYTRAPPVPCLFAENSPLSVILTISPYEHLATGPGEAASGGRVLVTDQSASVKRLITDFVFAALEPAVDAWR